MVDINLIPREYRERKERFKTIFSKTGGVILGLVILSLLFYGGLFLYQSNLKKNLKSIENEIIVMDSERNTELEKNIIDTDKRINLLKNLFQNHLYVAQLKCVRLLTLCSGIPVIFFQKLTIIYN